MKTILVPLEQHDIIMSTLETAVLLARAVKGHVEGFWLGPLSSPFIGADGLGAVVIQDVDPDQLDREQRECRRIFESKMRSQDLAPSGPKGPGPTYSWIEYRGQGERFLGIHGRVCDITIIGRPGSDASGPRFGTFEAALFDTGRPVLIAPPSSPGSLGENVLIAWDASIEASRTIAFAMPLLLRTTKTTILSISGFGSSEPSADALAQQLEYHGVHAPVMRLEPEGEAIGELILHQAKELRCDLLLKGAYTQTRLRELIFGSVSRHIVAQTHLPVLMAN